MLELPFSMDMNVIFTPVRNYFQFFGAKLFCSHCFWLNRLLFANSMNILSVDDITYLSLSNVFHFCLSTSYTATGAIAIQQEKAKHWFQNIFMWLAPVRKRFEYFYLLEIIPPFSINFQLFLRKWKLSIVSFRSSTREATVRRLWTGTGMHERTPVSIVRARHVTK